MRLVCLKVVCYRPIADRKSTGLAISGGVDSMALAALCSGIQQAPRQSILSGMQPSLAKVAATVLPDLRFQAFVVDHGVRKGSDIEARAVSSVLEQLGNGTIFI
jgi:tRNA(Ile)-lysidine synthase